MNQLQQDWIKALRSGEYKQSAGFLKTGHGFCCLGVLCDVSGYGEWQPYDEGGIEKYSTVIDHAAISYPPSVVSRDAGLNTDLESDLSFMNDHEFKTFGEIADFLEERFNDV